MNTFVFDIDQQSCKKCLHDRQSQHYKQHSDFEDLRNEIASKQERERRIIKKVGLPLTGNDDVNFFNIVCRKPGGLKDAKFLTTLANLRMQYFKHLLLLFGSHVEECPLPAGPSFHIDASRFWAVIIGIDGYKNISTLNCCVRDAQSFHQYLTTILGVPEKRVQHLLGAKKDASVDAPKSPNTPDVSDNPMYPSRTHITNTLLSLIDNPQIEKGDNIIIYYAGHGSSYECSDWGDVEVPDYQEISFGNTGHIEALCPIDRDTRDVDGNIVPDISDRELNAILTLISQAKGHHITVILDCCHSSGASREVPPPGARSCRATERATLRDMLYAGDKLLRDVPGYRSILAKNWSPNEDSHVVLAACKPYQFAREKWIKKEEGSGPQVQAGIFTHSLVRLLQSGYWSAETTYVELLRGLDKTEHQTPVVAGTHQNSRLWYQVTTNHEINTTGSSSYLGLLYTIFFLVFLFM